MHSEEETKRFACELVFKLPLYPQFRRRRMKSKRNAVEESCKCWKVKSGKYEVLEGILTEWICEI